MSIERYYNDALENMERTVHGLASCVPQPQRIPYKQSFVFRYVEKTAEQAIVQKLARIVSTLLIRPQEVSTCRVFNLGITEEAFYALR